MRSTDPAAGPSPGGAAPVIGVIADDVTGASDVASALAGAGVATVLLVGVPDRPLAVDGAEAVVIALRTRTASVELAVAESVASLRWLRRAGVRRVLSKVCSTFDSTRVGNIGPVADACLAELGASFALVCPANLGNGRTVYQGHLFVGDRLLSESPMRHHPLTPMTDPDLRRVLAGQTPGLVELVGHAIVHRGPGAARDALVRAAAGGARYAIADAVDGSDLAVLAEASWDQPLLVVAAGLAAALVDPWRRHGVLPATAVEPLRITPSGPAAVLAGSCSAATRAQVADASAVLPTWTLDPLALARDEEGTLGRVLAWVASETADGSRPVLIASTAPPDAVEAVQRALGRETAGALVERAFGALARSLVERGVRRLVVAGGETSGSVLAALGIPGLRIGPPIEPGVPWTESLSEPRLALALKSGNFGSPGFFRLALGLPWAGEVVELRSRHGPG